MPKGAVTSNGFKDQIFAALFGAIQCLVRPFENRFLRFMIAAFRDSRAESD